ncbi:MAG: hypothetical protein RMK18_11230 [Armatimonadota bacterium]|nr:hypothetical protein [Armatimonadota bacterium]MCX7778363.1 hypothetical protein [Armatimonadota bacterium]MDW8026420.1 hypothetical protein [Armatimonadota bacterium]
MGNYRFVVNCKRCSTTIFITEESVPLSESALPQHSTDSGDEIAKSPLRDTLAKLGGEQRCNGV